MAASPAVMVVAEIGERREQPGGKVGVRAEPIAVLVKANEHARDEVVGVGGVLQVAVSVGQERALPARDQAIERGGVALLKGGEAGAIGGGVGGHGRWGGAQLINSSWASERATMPR